MVNRLGKCAGIPLLGAPAVRRSPCWDSGALHTQCDERLNDHLLLFVSRSTKQHLFLEACLQSALMDLV